MTEKKIAISEVIVVEGRDDTAAIRRALDADTIETHGFGISKETWSLLARAEETRGLIIFTDPDHAGETIRTKLTEKFPKAKQAYLDRYDAKKGNDIGIENARPEAICKALAAARGIEIVVEPLFTMEDLQENGLCGGSDAAERRRAVGKHLGIGYGNSKGFLKKLNQYRITKEEFNEAILTKYHQGHQK